MRCVEEKIRNRAAHNIMAIKEEQFRQAAGISSKELLNWMKWLFQYTCAGYFESCPDAWDSYDRMNAEIIGRLKTPAAKRAAG